MYDSMWGLLVIQTSLGTTTCSVSGLEICKVKALGFRDWAWGLRGLRVGSTGFTLQASVLVLKGLELLGSGRQIQHCCETSFFRVEGLELQ